MESHAHILNFAWKTMHRNNNCMPQQTKGSNVLAHPLLIIKPWKEQQKTEPNKMLLENIGIAFY